MEFIFVMIIPLLAAKMMQFFLKETLLFRQECALYLAILSVIGMSWFSYGLASDIQHISGFGLICAIANSILGAIRITYLKASCGDEDGKVMNFWSLIAASVLPMIAQFFMGL